MAVLFWLTPEEHQALAAIPALSSDAAAALRNRRARPKHAAQDDKVWVSCEAGTARELLRHSRQSGLIGAENRIRIGLQVGDTAKG